MNRVIKFRGWDNVGNKGWVYGDLVHNQKVTKEGLEPRTMVGGYEVDPESVCQFIGLCDKNGKEIYEGDQVAYLGLECYVAFLPSECGFVIVAPKSSVMDGFGGIHQTKGIYRIDMGMLLTLTGKTQYEEYLKWLDYEK